MAALSQMESGTPDEDLGALSSSVGSSRNEDDLEDQSGGQGALSGQYDAETPEERAAYTGALTRLGQQPQTIDKAAQQKLDAIERAKQNILALSKYTPNPGQWANAAFGEPTNGGPGASLSNWYQGQLKGQQAQAEFARQQMGALNGLELAQGQVPWEAQSAQSAADERVLNTIANERTRREAIQERLQRSHEELARQHALDQQNAQYHDALVAEQRYRADQIAATAANAQDAGTWESGEGDDPDDPTKTVKGMYWLPKNRAQGQQPEFYPGKTITKGARAAGGADTPLMKNAKFYVDNKIAPDVASAVAMLRTSITNPTALNSLIEREKNILMRDNFGMDPDVAESQAKRNVLARQASLKAEMGQSGTSTQSFPGGTNTAANPGFPDINMPMPSSAATPSSAVPQTTLPPQAAAVLKEGVVTTFANGQAWKLENGKAVRVR